MTWLESPQKLLSVALLAIAVGFSIIAIGLGILTILAGT